MRRRTAKVASLSGGAVLLLGASFGLTYLVESPARQDARSQVQPIDPVVSAGVGTVTSSTPTAQVTTATPRPSRTPGLTPSPAAPKKPRSTPGATPKDSAKPLALPKTPFKLDNVVTGKCVGLLANEVHQYGCSVANGADLEWTLQRTRVVDGQSLYWIRDAAGEKSCLDLPNGGDVAETTNFTVYSCTRPPSADNQEFELRDLHRKSHGHEEYAVINYVNGMCLDVQNWAADRSDTADGLDITLYRCQVQANDWDDHLWTLR